MSDSALLEFLAHSRELEREAGERYEELADVMAAHHNGAVAAFFARMTQEAAQHLAEVETLAAGRELPAIAPWEFRWPGAEPPETASYEAVHYRMTLHEAMQLALANERAAQAFYSRHADSSADPEVRRIAAQFAAEEAGHAARLETLLAAEPAPGPLAHEEDDPPHQPD